jgi:hypothetical protein
VQGGVAAPPLRRKTSPIVWVLVAILVLCGLGLMAAIGAGAFVLHKMRRAGVDPAMFRDDPTRAVGLLIAAAHPDFEVLDADRGSGTVTLRDRRNGKRFTMSFDDARRGRFVLRADDSEGRGGALELGESAHVPAWIPEYPGSRPTPVFSARGESDDGVGEAGNFTFSTEDSTSRVLSFYEAKAREMGMTLRTAGVSETGAVTASDDERHRFLKVVVTPDSGRTTVNVTYGRKS